MDDKKDLTGILQYQQAIQEAGQAPPPPAGSLLEEVPIEKIDDFESLDDYAKANPTPEIAQIQESEVSSEAQIPSFIDAPLNLESPAFEPSSFEPSPSLEVTPPPSEPISTPIENIKKFVEETTVAKSSVPAAFPFSLLISGKLAEEEREKLLDLLSRENMGIREIDLEPQFASGRILIPRISEYAGILLIQALRSTQAKFQFAPSDELMSTLSTTIDPPAFLERPEQNQFTVDYAFENDAQNIPITTESTLPQLKSLFVIDTITASISIDAKWMESEDSSEYQNRIDALTQELKLKAARKGATGIIRFKIDLQDLSSSSHRYRLTAVGTAVSEPPKLPPDGEVKGWL